jgi:hypothetical protein
MDWKMRNFLLGIMLIALCGFVLQGEEKPKYQPTEIQRLRMEVRQRDAQLAQKDYFIAQQNFNMAVKALTEEAAKVKAENKWPDGLVFDQEKLTFTEQKLTPEPGRVQ